MVISSLEANKMHFKTFSKKSIYEVFVLLYHCTQ